MQIVTDSGMDLTPDQLEGLALTIMPLTITLDGISYRSGVDVTPKEFYDILEQAKGMPVTSLPSPGEFAEKYRELAKIDPDILSVHISSGLSGTYNAALEGAKLVPEANIQLYDTLTLSGAAGWHVEAACKAAQAGWSFEKIIAMLKKISDLTYTVYTLPTLKYLINGGRISHITGLIASALRIMPIIGVGKEDGKYFQRAKQRTFSRAMMRLPEMIAEHYPLGSRIRVQVMHANNPEGAERLQELIDQAFDCTWLPMGPIAPVLGAHTGTGMIGCAYASADDYPVIA